MAAGGRQGARVETRAWWEDVAGSVGDAWQRVQQRLSGGGAGSGAGGGGGGEGVGGRGGRRNGKGVEKGESLGEQRALAAALASGRRATVVAFYSPRCRLCQALQPVVEEVREGEQDWLSVVRADATSPHWLPEVGYYDVAYVPCFVLLDSRGRALAKTGQPYSRRHVLKGLSYLVESMRPVRRLLAPTAKETPRTSGG